MTPVEVQEKFGHLLPAEGNIGSLLQEIKHPFTLVKPRPEVILKIQESHDRHLSPNTCIGNIWSDSEVPEVMDDNIEAVIRMLVSCYRLDHGAIHVKMDALGNKTQKMLVTTSYLIHLMVSINGSVLNVAPTKNQSIASLGSGLWEITTPITDSIKNSIITRNFVDTKSRIKKYIESDKDSEVLWFGKHLLNIKQKATFSEYIDYTEEFLKISKMPLDHANT